MSDLKHSMRVEKSHQDNRVFVACGGLQIELSSNEEGVLVEITRGNEIISSCEADFNP